MTIEDYVLFEKYYYVNTEKYPDYNKELFDKVLWCVLNSKEMEDNTLLSLVVTPLDSNTCHLDAFYYNGDNNKSLSGYYRNSPLGPNLNLVFKTLTKGKSQILEEVFEKVEGTDNMIMRYSSYINDTHIFKKILEYDEKFIENFKEEEIKLIKTRG